MEKMVPWQLMQLHSMPYNAELSYTLCINFLHRHEMPRLDLQLADSYTATHKFHMIMLIEAMKVVILLQKMKVAVDPQNPGWTDPSEAQFAICQS